MTHDEQLFRQYARIGAIAQCRAAIATFPDILDELNTDAGRHGARRRRLVGYAPDGSRIDPGAAPAVRALFAERAARQGAGLEGERVARGPRGPYKPRKATPRKRRRYSKEARARMSAAAKARWAAKKNGGK